MFVFFPFLYFCHKLKDIVVMNDTNLLASHILLHHEVGDHNCG